MDRSTGCTRSARRGRASAADESEKAVAGTPTARLDRRTRRGGRGARRWRWFGRSTREEIEGVLANDAHRSRETVFVFVFVFGPISSSASFVFGLRRRRAFATTKRLDTRRSRLDCVRRRSRACDGAASVRWLNTAVPRRCRVRRRRCHGAPTGLPAAREEASHETFDSDARHASNVLKPERVRYGCAGARAHVR